MIRLRLLVRDVGQVVKADHVLIQPLPIGLGRCNLLLDLFVADDAPFAGVDQEHAARLQAALFQDALRRHVEHADFRRHDDQIVLGDVVARRPQAVAIEHGADHGAVGKGDRRRAIPGLHQAAVIFVEGPLLVVSCSHDSPTARESSSSWRAATSARSAPGTQGSCRTWPSRCRLPDDREDFFQIIAEQLGCEHAPGARASS